MTSRIVLIPFVRHLNETHLFLGSQLLVRFRINLYPLQLKLCLAAATVAAGIDRLAADLTEQSAGTIILEIKPLFMNPSVQLPDRNTCIK